MNSKGFWIQPKFGQPCFPVFLGILEEKKTKKARGNWGGKKLHFIFKLCIYLLRMTHANAEQWNSPIKHFLKFWGKCGKKKKTTSFKSTLRFSMKDLGVVWRISESNIYAGFWAGSTENPWSVSDVLKINKSNYYPAFQQFRLCWLSRTDRVSSCSLLLSISGTGLSVMIPSIHSR